MTYLLNILFKTALAIMLVRQSVRLPSEPILVPPDPQPSRRPPDPEAPVANGPLSGTARVRERARLRRESY
jgi:hypothetical protein